MAGFLCSILWVIFLGGTKSFAEDIYTNIWAVKVRGSLQEAKQLALRHGFTYDKHVSYLIIKPNL